MSLYYPGCVQMPGPAASQYPDRNSAEGVIEHSAEGYEAGLRAQLAGGQVSWHFTVYRSGRVEQHYALNASCWHAGSKAANARLVGVEHEGVSGQPLTNAQLAASVMLTRWIAAQGGWVPARNGHQTLYEHREVNPATLCPNGRIPWGYYEEAAVDVKPLDQSETIAFVQRFVGKVSEIVGDQDGQGAFTLVSGFPDAKPGIEYVILALKRE